MCCIVSFKYERSEDVVWCCVLRFFYVIRLKVDFVMKMEQQTRTTTSRLFNVTIVDVKKDDLEEVIIFKMVFECSNLYLSSDLLTLIHFLPSFCVVIYGPSHRPTWRHFGGIFEFYFSRFTIIMSRILFLTFTFTINFFTHDFLLFAEIWKRLSALPKPYIRIVRQRDHWLAHLCHQSW